jgi:hypothetical protein
MGKRSLLDDEADGAAAVGLDELTFDRGRPVVVIGVVVGADESIGATVAEAVDSLVAALCFFWRHGETDAGAPSVD